MLVDQTGRPKYGTFYPFPHDTPPVRIAPPYEKSESASRLDYAFVSPGVRVEKAWVLHGMQNAEGVPISDHLLMRVPN